MKKVLIIDPSMITEETIQSSAETVFDTAVSVVKKHGVCYMRFTREDGIEILDPKYSPKINGIISNA